MSKIKITENWNNIMCKNMVYFKSGNHKVRIFLSKKNEIKVVIFGDREGFLGDFESIMARIRGYYSTTEKMEELKSMLCKQRKETFYNGISLGLDYSSDLDNSIRGTTTSETTRETTRETTTSGTTTSVTTTFDNMLNNCITTDRGMNFN